MPSFAAKFAFRTAYSLLVLLACGFLCRAVHGQAVPVMYKTTEVTVFAGVGETYQDYIPKYVGSETIGVNLTRYLLKTRIAPSLEGRANISNGPLVNEHTYVFGLRAQTDFYRRFHVYGDFLAGPGTIHFNYQNNGYTGDNSTVYSYGGGLDIDVYKSFRAKADYQNSHWDLGKEVTFTPRIYTFGVVYIVPFKRFVKQSDPLYK